jgi:hypothetical protein
MQTNFEYYKTEFEKRGLTPPVIIFWRVDVKNIQQPVKMHYSGSILINGYSPSILKLILAMDLDTIQNITPMSVFLDTVEARYPFVEEIFKHTTIS